MLFLTALHRAVHSLTTTRHRKKGLSSSQTSCPLDRQGRWIHSRVQAGTRSGLSRPAVRSRTWALAAPAASPVLSGTCTPSVLLLYLRSSFQGPGQAWVLLWLLASPSEAVAGLPPSSTWVPHNQDHHSHPELCGLRNSGPRPFPFHRSMRYSGNRVIFLEEMNEEIIPTIYHW